MEGYDELPELLFRKYEVGATVDVGTMEDVKTIELLFRSDRVDTPDDVGTIESVETIELLFIANDGDMIEEDSELWLN